MSSPRSSTGIEGRIFVVGVPRSGTTLVQSLLAAHSLTTSFTETHFFDRHFRLLAPSWRAILTRDPLPRLREFLSENDEEAPEAVAWFAANSRSALGLRPLLPFQTLPAARHLLGVLDQLALRRGRSIWIEKTPRHLRYVPFLDRLSRPAAPTRFVHVVRDGLEVVASLHRASRSWERPYDLEACVRRWNRDVAFSLGRVEAPSDHLVLYEELTSRPEATLRQLFASLGLDWEPEILTRHAAASEGIVVREEEDWKGDVGRTIRPSASSDRTLTEEQRRRVRERLREDLYRQLAERKRKLR